MTPPQLAAIAQLHKDKTESITLQKAHGLAGYLQITFWLDDGKWHDFLLTPEGEIE